MSAPPGYSPDRRWWWDGVRWLPALSPDGRWFFDGTGWTPVRRPPRRLGAVLAAGAAWLVVLSVPPAVVIGVGASTGWTAVPDDVLPWLAGTGVLAGVATVALGVLLALRRWWAGLPIGVAAAVLLLGAWYVATMVASGSIDEPAGDDATGVGLLFVGGGTAVAAAALLAIGGAAGAVWRAARDRR